MAKSFLGELGKYDLDHILTVGLDIDNIRGWVENLGLSKKKSEQVVELIYNVGNHIKDGIISERVPGGFNYPDASNIPDSKYAGYASTYWSEVMNKVGVIEKEDLLKHSFTDDFKNDFYGGTMPENLDVWYSLDSDISSTVNRQKRLSEILKRQRDKIIDKGPDFYNNYEDYIKRINLAIEMLDKPDTDGDIQALAALGFGDFAKVLLATSEDEKYKKNTDTTSNASNHSMDWLTEENENKLRELMRSWNVSEEFIDLWINRLRATRDASEIGVPLEVIEEIMRVGNSLLQEEEKKRQEEKKKLEEENLLSNGQYFWNLMTVPDIMAGSLNGTITPELLRQILNELNYFTLTGTTGSRYRTDKIRELSDHLEEYLDDKTKLPLIGTALKESFLNSGNSYIKEKFTFRKIAGHNMYLVNELSNDSRLAIYEPDTNRLHILNRIPSSKNGSKLPEYKLLLKQGGYIKKFQNPDGKIESNRLYEPFTKYTLEDSTSNYVYNDDNTGNFTADRNTEPAEPNGPTGYSNFVRGLRGVGGAAEGVWGIGSLFNKKWLRAFSKQFWPYILVDTGLGFSANAADGIKNEKDWFWPALGETIEDLSIPALIGVGGKTYAALRAFKLTSANAQNAARLTELVDKAKNLSNADKRFIQRELNFIRSGNAQVTAAENGAARTSKIENIKFDSNGNITAVKLSGKEDAIKYGSEQWDELIRKPYLDELKTLMNNVEEAGTRQDVLRRHNEVAATIDELEGLLSGKKFRLGKTGKWISLNYNKAKTGTKNFFPYLLIGESASIGSEALKPLLTPESPTIFDEDASWSDWTRTLGQGLLFGAFGKKTSLVTRNRELTPTVGSKVKIKNSNGVYEDAIFAGYGPKNTPVIKYNDKYFTIKPENMKLPLDWYPEYGNRTYNYEFNKETGEYIEPLSWESSVVMEKPAEVKPEAEVKAEPKVEVKAEAEAKPGAETGAKQNAEGKQSGPEAKAERKSYISPETGSRNLSPFEQKAAKYDLLLEHTVEPGGLVRNPESGLHLAIPTNVVRGSFKNNSGTLYKFEAANGKVKFSWLDKTKEYDIKTLPSGKIPGTDMTILELVNHIKSKFFVKR